MKRKSRAKPGDVLSWRSDGREVYVVLRRAGRCYKMLDLNDSPATFEWDAAAVDEELAVEPADGVWRRIA